MSFGLPIFCRNLFNKVKTKGENLIARILSYEIIEIKRQVYAEAEQKAIVSEKKVNRTEPRISNGFLPDFIDSEDIEGLNSIQKLQPKCRIEAMMYFGFMYNLTLERNSKY